MYTAVYQIVLLLISRPYLICFKLALLSPNYDSWQQHHFMQTFTESILLNIETRLISIVSKSIKIVVVVVVIVVVVFILDIEFNISGL